MAKPLTSSPTLTAMEALRDYIRTLPEFSHSEVELADSPDSVLQPTGGSQVFIVYEGSEPNGKIFQGYKQRVGDVRIICQDTHLISSDGVVMQIDSLHRNLQDFEVNGRRIEVIRDVNTTPDFFISEGVNQFTLVCSIFL